MSCRNVHHSGFLPLISGLLLWAASPAFASEASQKQSLSEGLHFLGAINTPSLLEPANCHGSMGINVGAGADTYIAPEQNSFLANELGVNNSNYTVPRAYLIKGLPIPVDFGLTGGATSTTNTNGHGSKGFSQLSAQVQWTVYEALGRPALALRAAYGKLFGVASTTVSSTTAEAVASYGFWRYLNLFGRFGMSSHDGAVTIDTNNQLSYMLTSSQSEGMTVHEQWRRIEKAAGLRIMILPPFMSLTGEADFTNQTKGEYAAKLSYSF